MNRHESSVTDSGHWIAFVRLFVGAWWIIEATIGRFWKWGSFTSGVNPEWISADAGAVIISTAQTGIEEGAWGWYAWVLQNALIPYAGMWSIVISVLQLLIGITLMLGLLTRWTSLTGLVMLFSILLMGSFRTSPFLIAGHLFLIATNAGLYFGLDKVLLGADGKKDTTPSLFRRLLVTLNMDRFPKVVWQGLATIAAILGIYYLMQAPQMPSARYQSISLELFVFAAMVVGGTYLYMQRNIPLLTIATGFVRMYVGYKLLWWLFTFPQDKLTSLPGFVAPDDLQGVFEQSVATQWTPFAAIIETLFIPAPAFWSIIFGISQLVIGFMLILGWRARSAGWAAVWLMLLFTLLGFTRYAPYIMGFAFTALALGSGIQISLFNILRGQQADRSIMDTPLHIGQNAGIALGVLSIVGFALAAMIGVVPNGYSSAVGATIFWTLGINFGLVSIAWLFQLMTQSTNVRQKNLHLSRTP